MAYTAVDKSTAHFNTKIFSGTGSSNAVTGVGFQPDLVWFKNRSEGEEHNVFDVNRGIQKRLIIDTNQQQTATDGLTAFGADGFTVGSDNAVNKSSNDIVAWCWKGGGAVSADNNTEGDSGFPDGNGEDSTVSANTTAGISIIKYMGSGGGGANVWRGHGLGANPGFQMFKKESGRDNHWVVRHKDIADNKAMFLSNNDAETSTNTMWNQVAQNNTTYFIVGSADEVNEASCPIVNYCFAEVKGFSKFGKYEGNGNADGAFVYTGFRPAIVIMKCSSNGGTPWLIWDDKRSTTTGNVTNYRLRPDTTDDEDTSTADPIDLLSNGFKCRGTNDDSNKAGYTYIYAAFGQSMVGTNKVACTAR